MNLYDEWGIGAKDYNYGILLLVSKGDRKARIELGAGWTRERDAASKNIMERDIVPRFKQGDYSGGILAGVRQLDSLARVASGPAPSGSTGGAPAASGTSGSPATPGASPQSQPSSQPAPTTRSTYSNQSPRHGSSSRSSGGSGLGLLGGAPLVCLLLPVIGIFIVITIIKRAFGFGGGWGRGMYPGGYRGYGGLGGWGGGPYYGGGWGSGWGSSGGGGSSGWSGGSSDAGGGGGFSGGSFDGGSSGGGGATGSW
jgi:uncharacterized protein